MKRAAVIVAITVLAGASLGGAAFAEELTDLAKQAESDAKAGKHHEAKGRYGKIKVPVLVVYGDQDWSREDERQRTVEAIPGARVETVREGGHFLSLDQPQRLAELIKGVA